MREEKMRRGRGREGREWYLFTEEVGSIGDVVTHLALSGDADLILSDLREV